MKMDITIGEKYGPAMEITEQWEADRCFKELVEHSMGHGYSQAEAEVIERSNMGYYAGYGSKETRLRVERLFNCAHPIFGKASEGTPTAAEAFNAGLKMAKRRS